MLVVCRGTRLQIKDKVYEEGEECPDLPEATKETLVKCGTLVEPWKEKKEDIALGDSDDEDIDRERTDIDTK